MNINEMADSYVKHIRKSKVNAIKSKKSEAKREKEELREKIRLLKKEKKELIKQIEDGPQTESLIEAYKALKKLYKIRNSDRKGLFEGLHSDLRRIRQTVRDHIYGAPGISDVSLFLYTRVSSQKKYCYFRGFCLNAYDDNHPKLTFSIFGITVEDPYRRWPHTRSANKELTHIANLKDDINDLNEIIQRTPATIEAITRVVGLAVVGD